MKEDPIENKVRHIEALVGAAASVANTHGKRRVGLEHLLYVISGTEEGRRAIEGMGGRPRNIRAFLDRAFNEAPRDAAPGGTELDENLKLVTMRPIRRARENARPPRLGEIIQEMISLSDGAPVACQALIVGGILESNPGRLRESYSLEEEEPDVSDLEWDSWEDDDFQDHDDVVGPLEGRENDIYGDDDGDGEESEAGEEPLSDTAHPTEEDTSEHARAVAQATRDLTALARQNRLDDVIGRDAEIARIVETICKRKKRNMIVAGEPGVGKTALAEGLATFLSSSDAPRVLRGRPVLEISLSDLVAGARFRGDFEARMQKLVDMARTRRAILFLDEMHLMVGAGSVSSRGGMDAANILKPALARGEITVIGATTPGELREIRRDGALMRRFDMLMLDEPTPEQTRRILDEAVSTYVGHHEMLVDDEMLDLVVDLSARYLPAAKFPDKAFNVVDMACVLAKGRGAETVEAEDVRRAVERNGGARLSAPDAATRKRIAGLEEALSSRVFGQEEAVSTLARAARTASLGINQGGVAGAYLFNGPTGVGKSEMARAFADAMALPLVRIDMSEFMEKHSVSRLIGAPPGYVGYDQDGLLVNAADKHREMVLLLDEADKAHPDVFDILLQILDYGAVRAGDGRQVFLSGAHVIMSANIGAAAAEKSAIGFGRVTNEAEVVDEELGRTFRREMLSRIRNRVQFVRPDEEATRSVILKEMKRAARRLSDSGYSVVYGDGVVDLLQASVSTEFGMRGVEDEILLRIHDPLSTFFLETGARRARVDIENGEIVVGHIHDS